MRAMIKSVYRNLSRAIRLKKSYYRSYDVKYHPLVNQERKKIILASVDINEGIQLYSDNIKLVPVKVGPLYVALL